jgi:type VI protein secretion system component Hcp
MTKQRGEKDKEKSRIEEARIPTGELSDNELEKATGGGKVTHRDFQIQKYLDKASIIL